MHASAIIIRMTAELDSINLAELGDAEIVNCMRNYNYEKYKSLVRMHLSFELDLNTDEFDLPCHEIAYEDKGKMKKWTKKHKHLICPTTTTCASTAKATTANSSIEGLQHQIDAGFMFHLKELKEFLMLDKNLMQEGIFRKTGSVSRQNELRAQIRHNKPLNLELAGYSAHDCATVFKGFLSELTEPLLTDAHYPAHLQIAPLCIGISLSSVSGIGTLNRRRSNPERQKREQHLLHSMQLLLLLLPKENRDLLLHIMDILHAVVEKQEHNKMSAENLATLFAPHLICPRQLPPEALHYVAKKMSSILAYMIAKGREIFDVPAKLSTDIRAYFMERKRKKTMSPEQTLDDSISDVSTVNTVYTFVDRERTAAAHTKNTTDTELAQLYAHIQSLPESSRKRRLIKQFNKQNGQGTPLQLVIMNRLKNSEASRSAKSISDSIKKHIFHKGIMSRTPKRTTTATSAGVAGIETPNCTNTKPPKLRVLFQSPTPSSCNTAVAPSELEQRSAPIGAVTVTNTSYTIKTHPLQKSISSSSLLFNNATASSMCNLHAHHQQQHQHQNTKQSNDESEPCSLSSCSLSTNSNDGMAQYKIAKCSYSASAPVSRQTSCESSNMNTNVAASKVSILNSSISSSSSSSSTTSSQRIPLLDPNCCVSSLKVISEAAKHLIGIGDGSGGGGSVKKSVFWHDQMLQTENDNSNRSNDLKSRYKSEPNLSIMVKDKLSEIPETVQEQQQQLTSTSKKTTSGEGIGFATTGKSLTKLIKGVSMGNLRFPFSTPESTKRLVRSVSSSLKRRHSDEARASTIYETSGNEATSSIAPLLGNMPDLDDETFQDDSNDYVEHSVDSEIGSHHKDYSRRNVVDQTLESTSDMHAEGASSSSCDLPDGSSSNTMYLVQPSGLYRNIDLITSTPSLLLGRRSMSPITKSAKRMPKSMQESIMTPRSRKPVMVLTTTLGSSDPNQTIYQTDLSKFREQDEDNLAPTLHAEEDADSIDSYTDLIKRQNRKHYTRNKGFEKPTQAVSDVNLTKVDGGSPNNSDGALSNNFKEYLLSRSVLTASPVDASFSSHSDDFKGDDFEDDDDEGSMQELVDLNESQLSPSLLYCLDGNEPIEQHKIATDKFETTSVGGSSNESDVSTPTSHSIGGHISRRDSKNPFISLNNVRKRAAPNDLSKYHFNSDAAKLSIKPTSSNISYDQENQENVEDYLLSKKVLIGESPNETSF